MKRFFTLALAFMLLLPCAACSGGTAPSPDPAMDLAALFERLDGYWNTTDYDMLVGFEYQDCRPCILFGKVDGESTGYIEVTDFQSTGEGKAALTLFFPAQPADFMYPGPERTETVLLDLAGLERNGKISVKRGDREWLPCTYGGATLEEALAKAYENLYSWYTTNPLQ